MTRTDRLFSIGLQRVRGPYGYSYYDLLASEARLGSFIPSPSDSRSNIGSPESPYAASVGADTAQFTGPLFEYLMPLIFQRHQGKLPSRQAAREAWRSTLPLRPQARRTMGDLGSAFGIWTSTNYQYKALAYRSSD